MTRPGMEITLQRLTLRSLSDRRAAWVWFGVVALGILVGVGAGPLFGLVHDAGRSTIIPVHDLEADYTTAIVWAGMLGLSILLWPAPERDRIVLLALWVVKSVVALGFMLFYEAAYTSLDAYGYLAHAHEAHPSWRDIEWGEGSKNVIVLVEMHTRIFPDSYHALKVSFAMVGLIAGYIFFRAARAAGAKVSEKLLVLIVLTPSILFWSSIVGKDSLILFAFSIYCYAMVRWSGTGNIRWMLLGAVGLLLASAFRLWLAPIMALPALLLSLSGGRSLGQKVLLGATAAGGVAIGVYEMGSRFFRDFTLDIIEASNTYTQAWASGGSAQELSGRFASAGDIIRFLPLGMFTALFRPLPGEVGNAFGLLAGLENAVLLALFVLAIARTKLGELREPLVLWAASLVLCWGMIYGFLSYQNLGTAVRFRLQILPVFLLLLLYLARPRGQAASIPGKSP